MTNDTLDFDPLEAIIECCNGTWELNVNNRVSKRKYSDDPLSRRAEQIAYRRRHPDRVKVRGQNRRAKELQAPHDFTPEQWESALIHFNYRCAVCGSPAGFWTVIAMDHWIPISKGGGTTVTNIVPLCHAKVGNPTGKSCCNNSKGGLMPDEWLSAQYSRRKMNAILKSVQDYFDSFS